MHAARPRFRARMSFVPTESVEAASSRASSSGCKPANAPKPRAPVDSAAARSRSVTASAFSIETPASAYVCGRDSTGRVYGESRGSSFSLIPV